jgi:hypothetical protein
LESSSASDTALAGQGELHDLRRHVGDPAARRRPQERRPWVSFRTRLPSRGRCRGGVHDDGSYELRSDHRGSFALHDDNREVRGMVDASRARGTQRAGHDLYLPSTATIDSTLRPLTAWTRRTAGRDSRRLFLLPSLVETGTRFTSTGRRAVWRREPGSPPPSLQSGRRPPAHPRPGAQLRRGLAVGSPRVAERWTVRDSHTGRPRFTAGDASLPAGRHRRVRGYSADPGCRR